MMAFSGPAPRHRTIDVKVGGVTVGVNGGAIRVARPLFYAAQAILGCLIARAITPAIVVAFLKEAPLFVSVILAVVAASSLIGWLMSRWGALSGSTAVWTNRRRAHCQPPGVGAGCGEAGRWLTSCRRAACELNESPIAA